MKTTVRYQGDIAPDGAVVPFRVAVRDGVHQEAVNQLQQTNGVEIVDDPVKAQGMLIRSATKLLTAGDYEKYRQLMYLARVGVGMDNIDLKQASESGVATINTPGASTKPVAQRALTFILTWAAKTIQGTQKLSQKQWPKGDPSVEPIDLSEKTLGIVGYGRIGQEMERIAKPFFGSTSFTDVQNIPGSLDLPILLSQSDVISIHSGGTDEILTPDLLRSLKPGTLIVNTARGEAINSEALLENMDRGVYAALDVFRKEGTGMFEDPVLAKIVKHQNFLGTPHTGASDKVTQKKLALEASERMREYATQGLVNPNDLAGHTLPMVAPKQPRRPGIRGILTHTSVQGVLKIITGLIADQHVNIRELVNEDGQLNGGGRKLAMTSFDLEEQRIAVALRIMENIERELRPLKQRMLLFSETSA